MDTGQDKEADTLARDCPLIVEGTFHQLMNAGWFEFPNSSSRL